MKYDSNILAGCSTLISVQQIAVDEFDPSSVSISAKRFDPFWIARRPHKATYVPESVFEQLADQLPPDKAPSASHEDLIFRADIETVRIHGSTLFYSVMYAWRSGLMPTRESRSPR